MPPISLLKKPRITPSIKILKEKPGGREPIELDYDSAPEGLVPIGDTGLYITPDEPADPRDCDRYPDSIYCGSIPWTWTPIGLEPTIVIDECNIGITLTPILGWTILPIVSLVYRKEECRVPEPPPPIIHENVPMYTGRSWYSTRVINEYGLYGAETAIYATKILPVEQIPGAYYVNPSYNFYFNIYGIRGTLWKIKYLDCKGQEKYWNNRSYGSPGRGIDQEPLQGVETQVVRERIGSSTLEQLKASQYDANLQIPGGLFGLTKAETESGVDENDYPPEILTFTDVLWTDNKLVPYLNPVIGKTPNEILSSSANFPPSYCRPYYPPPLLPEKCCMQCCPPPNNSLLKLLIKKVDALSKVVGVDDYPVSLPASLISRDEGFLGNLIPNANKEIPSLTTFLAWYIERFDEIMGQWEIPIEIKDSDPSKPGDQPLGIKLPNMAEAIAEMFTLAFQTNLNSETLLNFAVRTAAEGVADKQQNFITYKLMQSMAEWAGYKQKDISLKMPILFSLGKTRYDEILNESEIDVPCTDFDEKFGLEADLMRFREAVAILQAVYKKKIDPSGDIKGQILKHLLDAFAAVNKVNGEDEDKDFEKFLTEVEDGFIKTSGVNNTTEPYGRPYKERPKIRDLTKHTPPTNP